MSLKNKIEKTMFVEGYEDRIQDIATLMDISVEIVKKRLKTLTFSDYINVMTALKTQDKDEIERIMGWPARDPNWKSPIDDIDESKILEDRTDVADRLADLANSQITDYFASEDELHDFMYSELTSDEDYHDGGKTLDWAMGRVNDDVKAWIDESSMADTLATTKAKMGARTRRRLDLSEQLNGASNGCTTLKRI